MDTFGRADRELLESLLVSCRAVRFHLRDPSAAAALSGFICSRRVGRLRYVVDRSSGNVTVDMSDSSPGLPVFDPAGAFPSVPTGGSPPHAFSALVEMASYLRRALFVVESGRTTTVTFMGLESLVRGDNRQSRRLVASRNVLEAYSERWKQGPCATCSRTLSTPSCRGCYHTDYMIQSLVRRLIAIDTPASVSRCYVLWSSIRCRFSTPCSHCFAMFTPETYHPFRSDCGCRLCKYIDSLGLNTDLKLSEVVYNSSDAYTLLSSGDASALQRSPSRSQSDHQGSAGSRVVCQACGAQTAPAASPKSQPGPGVLRTTDIRRVSTGSEDEQ